MRFIEALRLKSRLFLLFILITVGLVLLGMVGAIKVGDMKNRIDSLYFGSLIPVTELNEILDAYNGKILPSLYKAKQGRITKEEFTSILEESLRRVQKRWGSYKNHYKTREELPYVSYASSEISQTNDEFYKLLELAKNRSTLEKLAVSVLERKIEHVDTVVKKLLDYEMGYAYFERKQFLEHYKTTMYNIGIILAVIIFAVLFVTYYVFKSVQNEQEKLEKLSKKLHQANKKLENASYTDSLTGLHNRRYFNYIYDRELKRAKRERNYITFMMIDIDFFKQYNDTYGHIAGDHTLKIVAKVIKSCFKRPSDFVFRLGGEEFGVLLIGVDELGSARLAKELTKTVKEQAIEHKASKVAEVVTASVGVVSCIADEMLDGEALIQKADEMLYKAKDGGRDRYMITSEIYGNAKDTEEENLEDAA